MACRHSELICVAAVIMAAGCAHIPGTLGQQRLRATIHDPYPDPNLGPEVVGGRPRDYIEPLPEPVRNRLFVDSWWGRQR
jgi:hypothetical protein